jgi:hypothetical protein
LEKKASLFPVIALKKAFIETQIPGIATDKL